MQMTISNVTQPDSIIQDYVRHHLSPKQVERDMVSRRYAELQEILPGRTFQNGSWARHTSTTPVHDLDVFYILPESVIKTIVEAKIDPSQLDIHDILNSMAKELQKAYGSNATVVVQPHSVGIFFPPEGSFSIDVVPAQPSSNGLFLVPETAHLSIAKRRKLYESSPKLHWIRSDPQGYISQAQLLDSQTEGRFRRAAKFVKKWRLTCKDLNETFPLKSFHMEIAVTEMFKARPFASCQEVIVEVLSGLDSLVLMPRFRDRADANKYIDGYVRELSELQRSLVRLEGERLGPLLVQLNSASTEAAVLRAVEGILQIGVTSTPKNVAPSNSSRRATAYSKPYLS